MTYEPELPTHGPDGVLLLDDEREQDDRLTKALNRAYAYADAVRTKSLPLQIKTFDC